MNIVSLIGSVELTCAALVATASVVAHLRVNWRATRVGKHLLFYMTAFAVVLDLGALRFLFDGAGALWFEVVRLVAFTLVLIALAQRLRLQIDAQRRVRADAAPAAEKRLVDMSDIPDRPEG